MSNPQLVLQWTMLFLHILRKWSDHVRGVFWCRLYRQQLSAPFEEDARSGAALWPPSSIPGEETSPRLRGFQYTWSPGGTTSLSQSAGQYVSKKLLCGKQYTSQASQGLRLMESQHQFDDKKYVWYKEGFTLCITVT